MYGLEMSSEPGAIQPFSSSHATDYIMLNGSLVATVERPLTGGTGTVEYQHTDALGSSVAVTDASRTVIETSEYEPFGRVANRAARDGAGYTGHAEDAATGLTYMQQRYYDPQIGRFLSVDPVTPHQNPATAFNRYWYANGNPYSFTDPNGRSSVRTGSHIQGGSNTSAVSITIMNESRSRARSYSPGRSGRNGRNYGSDSISRITRSGTSNATNENISDVMAHFGIKNIMGVTVIAGDAGDAAAYTDSKSGAPTVVIGQAAFNFGLTHTGNIILHELYHGRSFQIYGNIKSNADIRMREIGAHRYNLQNPLPGTKDWEITQRQTIINNAYHHLSDEQKNKVDSGIYYDGK